LRSDTLGKVDEILSLPAEIRGYEHIKSDSVTKTKQRAATLLSSLTAPPAKRVQEAAPELA
jgi:hypothetical protein